MQCNAYTLLPPPLKLSHRYATEVDFQIYEMGPLAHYMAHDFFIPNLPLSTAHTIVELCAIRDGVANCDVMSCTDASNMN